MSIEMITSFMQPSGDMSKTALTVIKKPNKDVELITTSEDKTITQSLERINELVVLHNRVKEEGMSRGIAEEMMRIAPAAVPGGYGLEAFTTLPSNVMAGAGMEGLASNALAMIKKMIKFLIEKLKAGYGILLDSYNALTGISPSAYKLAKQEMYNEIMIKNWKAVMQTNLDEDVLNALTSGAVDEPATRMILDGYFNDSNTISSNLAAFEPLVSSLQRAVEEMLLESSIAQSNYNKIWTDIRAMKDPDDEAYIGAGERIAGMMRPVAFEKISRLLEQLAKKTLESKLYKPDDKTGKSIVDRLNSDNFREMLIGLQDACHRTKPVTLKPSEAFLITQEQDLDALVKKLTTFNAADTKNTRDLKRQIDQARVYDQYVSMAMTGEDGFETISAKFLEQQNDVKAIAEFVRELTAQYAEAVFKLLSFRNTIRQVVIVRMTAESDESKAMEATEEEMVKLKKSIREWIAKVTGRA